MSCEPVKLQHAGEQDRTRIARIRAPRGMGPFVHYNWFWLDRALADAAITFALVRGGARGGITGCIAYGPHEQIDLDPASRTAGVGEIYHVVIDRRHAGRGQGPAAVSVAIRQMRSREPRLAVIRASHHAENNVAARMYDRLGFIEIGEKIDGETGIRDRLVELRL